MRFLVAFFLSFSWPAVGSAREAITIPSSPSSCVLCSSEGVVGGGPVTTKMVPRGDLLRMVRMDRTRRFGDESWHPVED